MREHPITEVRWNYPHTRQNVDACSQQGVVRLVRVAAQRLQRWKGGRDRVARPLTLIDGVSGSAMISAMLGIPQP